MIYDSPEITHPMNLKELFSFEEKDMLDAEETKIEDVNMIQGDVFYYLFDFGDEWWHELTVLKIREGEKTGRGYPKVTKKIGQSPDQYPETDDDMDEEDF